MAAGNLPWVLVRLQDSTLALESEYVREMLVLPAVVGVPQVPRHFRGVMNLRGNVLPVLDLRLRLGLPPALEERLGLIELMNEREQDHHRWLDELEACAHEGRSFTLTTDPHACAFGRWYDQYEPPNIVLGSHLKKFAEPHKAIHAVGVEVTALLQAGRKAEALKQIEETRVLLHRLSALFAEGRRLIEETAREIVIVVQRQDARLGLICDRIESVEHLQPDSVQPIAGDGCFTRDEVASRTGMTRRGDRLVMVLDAGRLLDELPRAAA